MKKPSFSLKHILNKNLNPLSSSKYEVKLYPIYNQLIYKRKNYLFKSIITTYYDDLESVNTKDRQRLDFEVEFLSSIIDYEINLKGDKFDVPGFADKYNHYRRSVVEEAERLLIGKVEHIIRSKRSKYEDVFNYKYAPGKLKLLLEAISSLMPELLDEKEIIKCKMAELFWKEYNKTFLKKKDFGLTLPVVFEWITVDHKLVMTKIFKYKGNDNFDLLMEYVEEFDALIRAVTIDR